MSSRCLAGTVSSILLCLVEPLALFIVEFELGDPILANRNVEESTRCFFLGVELVDLSIRIGRFLIPWLAFQP